MALINLLTDLSSFYHDNPFHQKYKGSSNSSTPPNAVAKGNFDQKSLKFGHDRIGGGSSNQPYIKSPIPDKIGEYGFLNTDFILRGGSKAITNSLTDVGRLTKYFTDVRNPSGLLFVAKQNLLSRMAVRTQASGFLLNEGVYTPLSTLIEAGGVAFGLHVNKQGINPFGGIGGINTYSEATEQSKSEVGWEINDRLTVLYNFKIVNEDPVYNLKGIKVNSGGVNVLSYSGGPGSFLGIGKTNIKFAGSSASERTGLNNPNLKGSSFFNGQSTKYGTLNQDYSVFKKPTYTNINGTYLLGVSRIQGIEISKNGFNVDGQVVGEFRQVGQLNTVDKNVSGSTINSYNSVYTQQQLNSIPKSKSDIGESSYIGGINSENNVTTPGDFRSLLRKNLSDIQKVYQKGVGNLTNAPNYTKENIETRLFLGDPGNRNGKNLTSYTTGSGGSYFGAASPESYDMVTASEINDDFQNDLVKFRIEVIDNDTPSNTTKLQFRAFLNTISDQYSADWNPTKYLGRGENFYTYGGFDRKVSLSWTVAAQSKKELIPMYKKLNYLASVCAPDYSEQGYMRGNLVKLTIGGYFYEQYGIITGLSYEMNDDSATWEIGINDSFDNFNSDPSVKELPHLIKVSSFNFIPIHDFVPRKVRALTNTTERFIALEANGQNNY